MPAFKDELGLDAARALSAELSRAWPEFPRRRFLHRVGPELDPLELLARSDELARRLVRALPSRFEEAAGVLRRALDSPSFAGWMVMPCGGFVARAGLHEPEQALPLLAALTPRWSSEFALRPFLQEHATLTYALLRRWTEVDDEHVRRLVSEGTRPRLPWAPQLRSLVADPSPNVPLLDRLADDPSLYVRRSVGNHLNDISKDHPDLALELAARWQARGDRAAWAARLGLRTLVKAGDRRALSAIGADPDRAVELRDLSVDRGEVPIGGSLAFSFRLRLPEGASDAVDAVIDYRVRYAGARGLRQPKVFKLTRRRLQPGRTIDVVRRHAVSQTSVRRLYPGDHRLEVQVNGRVLGSVPFVVVEP